MKRKKPAEDRSRQALKALLRHLEFELELLNKGKEHD